MAGVEGPRRLADFLRERRDQILEAWEGAVREVSTARDLPRPLLLDHMPQFIETSRTTSTTCAPATRPTRRRSTRASTRESDTRGAFDPDRTAQVVSNLVANAIHHSPESSAVRIGVRGEKDELVLEVHNEGAPIPAEVMPRLFEAFQPGVKESGPNAGLGLGLYIVQQIVDGQGGDPPLDPPTECAYVSRLENLPCSKNALTLVLDGG
jgi:signal transduction histidine kinase